MLGPVDPRVVTLEPRDPQHDGVAVDFGNIEADGFLVRTNL